MALQAVAAATVAAQVGSAVYRTVLSRAAGSLLDALRGVYGAAGSPASGIREHLEVPELRERLTRLDLEASMDVLEGVIMDCTELQYIDARGNSTVAGTEGVARASANLASILDALREKLLQLQQCVADNKGRWFKHFRASPFAPLVAELKTLKKVLDNRLDLLIKSVQVSQLAAATAAQQTRVSTATAVVVTDASVEAMSNLSAPGTSQQRSSQPQQQQEQNPAQEQTAFAAVLRRNEDVSVTESQLFTAL